MATSPSLLRLFLCVPCLLCVRLCKSRFFLPREPTPPGWTVKVNKCVQLSLLDETKKQMKNEIRVQSKWLLLAALYLCCEWHTLTSSGCARLCSGHVHSDCGCLFSRANCSEMCRPPHTA